MTDHQIDLFHAIPNSQVLSRVVDAMQTGCQCLKGASQAHVIMLVATP